MGVPSSMLYSGHVKDACHGRRGLQPREGPARPEGLDAAGARRCGRGLAPEHQLDRARAVHTEPRAGPRVRAGLQGAGRGDLRARKETMMIEKLVDERFLAYRT